MYLEFRNTISFDFGEGFDENSSHKKRLQIRPSSQLSLRTQREKERKIHWVLKYLYFDFRVSSILGVGEADSWRMRSFSLH